MNAMYKNEGARARSTNTSIVAAFHLVSTIAGDAEATDIPSNRRTSGQVRLQLQTVEKDPCVLRAHRVRWT